MNLRSPDPVPDPPILGIRVPGTNTVVEITPGRPVLHSTLQALFIQAQSEIDRQIKQYGLNSHPGNPEFPSYHFMADMSRGKTAVFYAYQTPLGDLTYRLVNNTLAGLRLYLIGGGRDTEAEFGIVDNGRMEAYGKLLIRLSSGS